MQEIYINDTVAWVDFNYMGLHSGWYKKKSGTGGTFEGKLGAKRRSGRADLWSTHIPSPVSARQMLPLSDVMAVHYVHSADQTHCCPVADQQNGNNTDDKPSGEPASVTTARHTSFVLHYAARGDKNRWKHHTVTMNHTDCRQVASWVKTIRNYLSGEWRHQHFSVSRLWVVWQLQQRVIMPKVKNFVLHKKCSSWATLANKRTLHPRRYFPVVLER